MEVQKMGPWLFLEHQLAGHELSETPCVGLIFFLNKPRKPQARAGSDNLLAGKLQPPACMQKLLEIWPRSGQSCATCGSSWRQLWGRTIHHLPRQFHGDLLVHGWPKHKFLKDSMLLQVVNLHMRIRGSFPNPCFSAQFDRKACQSEVDDFAQDMFMWSEAFVWGNDYSELLLDLASEVANNLLLISKYWYAKLSFYHILPLEIVDLSFRSMIFAAQGLKCQNWKNIHSVSLWNQANIIATNLKHKLCSHTTNEIYGQQRSWNCLYACKTINSGNAIRVQTSFLMSSKGTMFCLPDDHLVEDAVLLPFGLCHQSWTTTPLSLIPRFNGGDLLRLSLVMVHQNLQLNPSQPRVHTPDRPSGEPPTGHQLV